MKNANCPLLSGLCGKARALCWKQGELQTCGEKNFSFFTSHFSFLLSLGFFLSFPRSCVETPPRRARHQIETLKGEFRPPDRDGMQIGSGLQNPEPTPK